MEQVTIQCPACNSQIVVVPYLLIKGQSFVCTNLNCDSIIALDNSSKLNADNGLDQFNKLKNNNI